MAAEIREHLLATLRARCEAIADRWYRAVAGTSYSSLDGSEVRARLVTLTDRASDVLLAEPFAPDQAGAIGAELAALHYLRPVALGRTIEVLARELVADAPAASRAALQPRLAVLLGAVAQGYYDRARATILAEQEAARAPQVAELRRVQGALRAGEARLRAVATNIPVMLFALDRDGVFTFAAGKGLAAIGLAPEQIVGQSVFALFAGVPQLLDDVRRTLAGEDCTAVAEVGAVVVDVRHTPVRDGAGAITGVIGVAIDITARTQAESALRRARDFNAAILDTAGSLVVVLDRQGRIVRFNWACERLTGYAFAEVRDRPFWDIFLLPDERAGVEGVFAALCAGRFPNEHENHWATKAGEHRLIDWANTALLDGAGAVEYVVGIGIDVTERWQAEVALRASEARFRAIFDGAAIGIALVDAGGRLLESNRALCEMLGYDADELRSMAFPQVTHSDDVAADLRQYRALLAGEIAAYQLEKRYIRKDGAIIQGRLTVSLVDAQGDEPPCAISMVQDITAHKRAAAERDEARHRLAEALEAERLRLAQDLHDGAVQDLIGVRYQLMAAQQRAGPLPPALATALSEGQERLLDVIGQLRGAIGELRPDGLDDFGLPGALEELVADLRRAALHDAPVIALHLDPGAAFLPAPVARHLFRIAQEALRNALAHARARRVTVDLHLAPEEAELCIRDDGQGFAPPPNLSRLARSGHFGLIGLAERLEWAAGRLEIRAAPGAGTTITARLPLAGEGRDDERANSHPASR